MTVLVTGGSGLVGSHVIAALRTRGVAVRALVRDRRAARAAVTALGAEPVIGDVTDAAAWRQAAAGVRGIVHAAALVQQRGSFEAYAAVNVEGTRLAIATARAAGARMVHISSTSVYAGSAAYTPGPVGPRDEDSPFSPIPDSDVYARTKRLSEALVREAAAAGEVTAIVLRPNVIYGERDRLFTPGVLRFARLGFFPAVGDGHNHLSCVYAGNVAAAAVAALEAPITGSSFRVYNITTDRPPALTEREFFAAFGEACGRRMRRILVPQAVVVALGVLQGRPRLGRNAVSFLNGENPYVAESARRELGWDPPYSTREAIQRTVENEMPGR